MPSTSVAAGGARLVRRLSDRLDPRADGPNWALVVIYGHQFVRLEFIHLFFIHMFAPIDKVFNFS
jgi:hypothetical protein